MPGMSLQPPSRKTARAPASAGVSDSGSSRSPGDDLDAVRAAPRAPGRGRSRARARPRPPAARRPRRRRCRRSGDDDHISAVHERLAAADLEHRAGDLRVAHQEQRGVGDVLGRRPSGRPASRPRPAGAASSRSAAASPRHISLSVYPGRIVLTRIGPSSSASARVRPSTAGERRDDRRRVARRADDGRAGDEGDRAARPHPRRGVAGASSGAEQLAVEEACGPRRAPARAAGPGDPGDAVTSTWSSSRRVEQRPDRARRR